CTTRTKNDDQFLTKGLAKYTKALNDADASRVVRIGVGIGRAALTAAICRQYSLIITTSQEAGMPRGDELREEYLFSDRDDDVDDLGYGGGGGSSYDSDDEEDGGWMTHKDDSDDLWDSAEDVDEDEEETSSTFEAAEDEEEEEDVFGSAPRRGRGRPANPANA